MKKKTENINGANGTVVKESQVKRNTKKNSITSVFSSSQFIFPRKVFALSYRVRVYILSIFLNLLKER